MIVLLSTKIGRRDGRLNGVPHGHKEVTMSTTTIKPDSGLQLLIMIGAGFIAMGIRPDIGMMLLVLGVSAWIIYNIPNIGRQF